MVKINNSFIKKISQSEIALFVFLIMALGNLLTFLDNNDLGGIILFFIIGFLIMMKNKNMVIVLGLTMILTNITILSIIFDNNFYLLFFCNILMYNTIL